jgi:hypothetical protein
MTVKIGTTRSAQSASVTTTLPQGTYQIGACIINDTLTPISNNDFVNGWILVHN